MYKSKEEEEEVKLRAYDGEMSMYTQTHIPDLSHSKSCGKIELSIKQQRRRKQTKRNQTNDKNSTMNTKLVLLRNRLNGFLGLLIGLLAC